MDGITTERRGQDADPWGDELALPPADIFVFGRRADQEPDADDWPDETGEYGPEDREIEPQDLWEPAPAKQTATSTAEPAVEPEATTTTTHGRDIDRAWASARKPWIVRAAELAEWTLARALNRSDAWGHYIAINKRKGSNTYTAKAGKNGTLDMRRLERHYRAANETDIVGLHTTSQDNTSLWGAVEIDRHDDSPELPRPQQILTYALHLLAKIEALGFAAVLLTDSNGKGGLHLRVFFSRPVPTGYLFRWLQSLVADFADFGFDRAPETFPKQEGVDPDRPYGNWLRLPGRHHTRRHLSRVWDGSAWMEGNDAIERILAIKGDDPALMPMVEPPPKPTAHEGNGDHRHNGQTHHRLLVDRWLADRGYPFTTKRLSNRTLYLIRCPHNPEHGDHTETAVMQWDDGKLGYQCKHHSCDGRGWQQAKEAIGEPDPDHYDPPLRNRAKAATNTESQDTTPRQIRNWQTIEVEDKDSEPDEDGKKKRKTVTVPMPMSEVFKTIKDATDDWPRRVGTWLFSHRHPDEINWHNTTSSTFAFLAGCTGVIRWRKGDAMVSKEETHEGLKMEATNYIGVEVLPHWPHVPKIYYACTTPKPGDGSMIRALLGRFCPSTDIDRDLLLAAFVTPGWGGPPGARPAFLITSDAGRGAGKSKNASMVGKVWGQVLDFDQHDNMSEIKQRLLSDEGLTKRVALLDNVKTLRFSWGAMEGLITNPTISGKRMYVGEGSRPNLLTWFITLNGASLSRDVAQRVVVIKIDRPAYTGDWEEDTNKFIDDNRDALLADVAAFFAQKPDALKRFTRWGAWEKDVLARLPDPSEAQAVIAERQGQVDVEAEEANVIEDFFADQLAKFNYDAAADVVFIPTQEAARWLNWATNEKHGVTAASRIIKQLASEGQIRRLKPDPSRTCGRGFRWTGEAADVVLSVWTDLEKRISEYMKAQKAADG